MKATRTLNTGLCLDVISNHKIFNAISEDGVVVGDVEVDVINQYWVKVVDEDIVIGVFELKQRFSNCYEAHIHILPEHRDKSVAAGRAFLLWAKDAISGSSLVVEIPEIYQNVIDYVRRFEFRRVGILKSIWLKEGCLHDMIIFQRRV